MRNVMIWGVTSLLTLAVGGQLSACRGGSSSDIDGGLWWDTGSEPDGDDDSHYDGGTSDGGTSDGGTSDGGSCQYPPSPHTFDIDATIPAMSWEDAFVGTAETGLADLAALCCDADVHSIFIQVTTTECPTCVERMGQIAGLADHWATYGARWVFLVSGADSASTANDYVNRFGIDFGYRSNDADNGFTVVSSSLFEGVPWTAVIRTSDMTMVYEESDTSYLPIEQIAQELAGL